MPIPRAKHYLFALLLAAAMSTAAAQVTVNPGDSIQAAIDAANPGDIISLAAGDHVGFTLNKAVTIQGPNVGTAGTGTRVPEARIVNATISITADNAVLDGVKIFRDNADTTSGISLQAAATIRNSVFERNGSAAGTVVRAIEVAVGTSGFTIERNSFTGDASGGFFGGHTTWNNCIYSNITSAAFTANITNNTFDVCRTALNFDGFSTGINVSGNTFLRTGTHISFGSPQPAGSYTLTGNDFGIDFSDPLSLPSAMINNNNVASTFSLDLTGNNFGGVAANALTLEQQVAIEARMFHRGRSGRQGVVKVVAGEQVVVAQLTTVASAIEAAEPGNTITVFSNDPYPETIITDGGANCTNPFTLASAGTGAITLTFTGLTEPFLLLAPGSNITVVPDTLLCAPPPVLPASVGGFAEPLFPAREP